MFFLTSTIKNRKVRMHRKTRSPQISSIDKDNGPKAAANPRIHRMINQVIRDENERCQLAMSSPKFTRGSNTMWIMWSWLLKNAIPFIHPRKEKEGC
jgi:hypothetical protein